MLSNQAKIVVREEWRKLGFFYDRDDDHMVWKIIGSRDGIDKFSKLLIDYSNNQSHNFISAHENYGPYSYLEIGTWGKAEINAHWIAGPIPKLVGLAKIVERIACMNSAGDIVSLKNEFSPKSPYELEIHVRSADFDPSTEDVNFSFPMI